ncbi:DUF739 family protein [Actinotignum sanguinis]|uniref:DUF739 family protein n=2 Tax=Actinomycetales TaxID=2037 RepID=UPI003B97BE2E
MLHVMTLCATVGHMETIGTGGFDNANTAIGSVLNQYLFECDITKTHFAQVLNANKSVLSRKLRGRVTWSATEIATAAAFLGLEPNDIMPTMHINNGKVYWQPAPYKPGYAHPRTDLLCPRKDSNLRPTA